MKVEASTGEPILRVEGVGFSYADTDVLDGIDLVVEASSIVALVGPNGAGKSTLIRCICGRLTPDRGRICLAQSCDGDGDAGIGLVPQQIALYPHLSVAENIAFFSRLAGVARQRVDAAVEQVIAWCDLGPVARRRAGILSGGWQRRANIACALGHAPKLLVLDEPMVGIDPPARDQIEALLQRLAGEGIAMLMTSHDLSQLERIAGTLGFLSQGRIVATGAPRDLLREFFGNRRECRVRVETAGDSVRERLSALGFEPEPGDLQLWSALVEDDRAERLQVELAGREAVREFFMRQPGLELLWRRLYGDNPEPLSC